MNYNFFLNEMEDFSIEMGWFQKPNTYKCSISELEIFFEKRIGFKINSALEELLLRYGKQNPCKIFWAPFSLNSIESGILIEKEEELDGEELWSKILSKKIKNTSFEERGRPVVLLEMTDIDMVIFTFSEDKYFNLIHFDLFENKFNLIPFLTYVRKRFLNKLLKDNVQNTKVLDKIPWLAFYKHYKDLNIQKKRLDFLNFNFFLEVEMDRIMGLDEVERECIKYLIKNYEEFKNIPHIYDPYNDKETFYEYLKESPNI